jgi:DNA repair protein RecN (Recombination protein N)
MLTEIRVVSLGVFADLTLVLGPGMTALTGETGAGKTLVVEAIELLLGGRADPVLVRPGDEQASVEARFSVAGNGGDACDGGDDLILSRTVPASGRSRAHVNGRMAPLAELAKAGERLVDLHGQHDHQSLLSPAVQRAALDRFGAIDHGPVAAARAAIRANEQALAAIGGDARARAREIDLLRFQISELDAAALDDPLEEQALTVEEDRLADASAHREAAAAACFVLSGDGGAGDRLGEAVAALAGRPPLAAVGDRLRAAASELADAAGDLRDMAEQLEDDPERLAAVRARRQLLRELRRKYGEGLADVIAYRSDANARLDELVSHEARVAELEQERATRQAALERAEDALGGSRRSAAPALAAEVERCLHHLAMPRARFRVCVGADRAGDEVTWLLGANPGEAVLPLSKVASGGELARTMLAVRLALGPGVGRIGPVPPAGELDGSSAVVTGDPPAARDRPTLVFDEVDAGVGGEAAVAVGRALADLAEHHQVLVVTHLPQVAAFADQQIAVRKDEAGGRTVAQATVLGRQARVVELSRMLSGQPDSATARRHAEELLATAAKRRRPRRPSSTPGSPTR